MHPNHHKLLEQFGERFCNDEQKQTVTYVSADDVMAALWPLNKVFFQKLHQIRSMRYQKQFEKQADKAIEDYIFQDHDWGSLPLVVQRVLLERHMQAIILCVANDRAGNNILIAPIDMSLEELTKYSVLFLYYRMKLPFPIDEKRAFDFDSPLPGQSDLLH